MWVADMDFPAPKPVLAALRKAVDHGVLGYELPSLALKEIVAARMDKLYKWKVKPESVIATTGIVSGFSVAAGITCTPKEGEGHIRLNFGTSRALLKTGLDKMRKALSQYQ